MGRQKRERELGVVNMVLPLGACGRTLAKIAEKLNAEGACQKGRRV